MARGGAGAADRLRQCGQPADRARSRAPARDRHALLVGRNALAAGAAMADRKPAAGAAGQHAWAWHSPFGASATCFCFCRPALVRDSTSAPDATVLGVHAGHLDPFGGAVRTGAGPARDLSRSRRRAEGWRIAAARSRRARRLPQSPGGGAGGAFLWCWWWRRDCSRTAWRACAPSIRDSSPRNVVTFSLDYPRAWKNADKEKHRERLLARLAAVPGMASISYGAAGSVSRRLVERVDPRARIGAHGQRRRGDCRAGHRAPRTLKPWACRPLRGQGIRPEATCAPPARSPW